MAGTGYFGVLHRVARLRAGGGVELSCLVDRNDGVVLAVDQEEGRRRGVNARYRRRSNEDLSMARLTAPHDDPLEEPLEVPTGRVERSCQS